MDQHNIDRLFREKLDLLEKEPSKGAWSQIEKQIRRKNTPYVYWVAASVSLFLLSWIVWPAAQSDNFTPIAGEVSHPVFKPGPDFVMPVIKEATDDKVVKPSVVKEQKQPRSQFASNDEMKKESQQIEKTPIFEVESKTMVAEVDLKKPEIKKEVIEQVNKPDFRVVKITYIASAETPKNEKTQKADSTSTLKKFIAFAGSIDPGDVLADIKTAKDNLLNGGLKSKKERNSL